MTDRTSSLAMCENAKYAYFESSFACRQEKRHNLHADEQRMKSIHRTHMMVCSRERGFAAKQHTTESRAIETVCKNERIEQTQMKRICSRTAWRTTNLTIPELEQIVHEWI